ncbi:MAG: hypothetical protein IKK13_03880 [Clostridia bacterium]|nr:hypothetical protein [Clostridia bacterium]
MAKRDYSKLEAEKQKIADHFKKEKKKVWISFIIIEIVLLVGSWIICNLVSPVQGYIYFIIALFFTRVFPITQFSKKMKELTHQEKEQLGFAEQDY